MICYIQLDPNLKHKLYIFSRKYQRSNPFGTFMSAGGLLSVAGRTTKIRKIWVSNVIVYSWPANRRACVLLAECWNYLFPLRALRTSEDRIWKIWVSNVIVYSWPANRRACVLLAECWNYLFPLRA